MGAGKPQGGGEGLIRPLRAGLGEWSNLNGYKMGCSPAGVYTMAEVYPVEEERKKRTSMSFTWTCNARSPHLSNVCMDMKMGPT